MSASLAMGSTVGRYQVRSFLGAGGMGEVYAAWEPSLEREVALKILRPDLTSDARRVGRFVTEARAASALNHPAVVTIYEIGQERSAGKAEGLHYIAMERIDGVTLAEWIGGKPSLDTVLDQLAEIADGVAEAHARGIIHRDLKPENIMVSRSGHAKVLDFGVAKLVELDHSSPEPVGSPARTLTENRTLVGTPQYRSPEQIEGVRLDHRADIFSLGCVLHECLTGRSPFARATTAETLHSIVHGEPPSIALSNREATRMLNRIMSRCLAKDRDARYDSARDLSHDLREAARIIRGSKRNVRSLSRAPSAITRSFVGRFALVAAFALLVAVITSWSSRSQLQAVLEEQREQNSVLSASLAKREQEVASRGIAIERLRAERDEADRLRDDLETSYRALLADVSSHLSRTSSESSQLRERVTSAENDLQKFREDLQRRNAEQVLMQRLERQLGTTMTARAEPRGVVAIIPGALFSTGRAQLAHPGLVLIEQIAAEMLAERSLHLTIEGHTDSNGDSDENLELSQARADFVRSGLIAAGVDDDRITAIGRGEAMPAFDNRSQQGRMHNRRVELLFSVAPRRSSG